MTATTDGSTGAMPPRVAAASETDINTPVAAGVHDAAAHAVQRATDFLLSQQDAQGWWKGDLETNVTMDAEDLLLRQFLGIREESTTQAAALFIRGEQREDGTWASFYGGPGELSTTIEAYVALRLAGDAPDAPHMAKASAWVRERGGIASARVFTRIWLALFGWWKWDDLPELPPELLYFPTWVPLNIYDFGCWARQTIVPLTVVSAKRPVRPAPFPLDELHTDPDNPNPVKPLAPVASWDGAFQRIDKALHLYRKVAPRKLRRSAMNAAARWIIERQENDGCWGGIQPPAVYSVIALHLLGYDLEHPVMRAGLESLDRFAIWREDGARMIEACQSPVWDTCLATIALADAGVPADHPQLVKAADWMLGRRSSAPATGRSNGPNCRRAAGRSSSTTTTTPTSTTPPRWCSRCAGSDITTRSAWTGPPDARSAGTSACSRRTAVGAPSTSTTPARSPTGCRSATSARSSTRRRRTSPRTSSRCSPSRASPTTRAPGAASSGCSPNRSRTARGSAAGASTTSTAPGPSYRRSPRPGSPARTRRSGARSAGWRPYRTTTAAGARTCAPTSTPRSGAAGAPRPPRRRPGR